MRQLTALISLIVLVPLMAQVMLPHRRPTSSVASVLLPPIDVITNAPWLGYSVARKLRAAWTGPAYAVARSSDGATQHIGFDASGDVDTAALLSFVGANNGYVSHLYDQSGNGRHATNYSALTKSLWVVTNGTLNIDAHSKPVGWMDNTANQTYLSYNTGPAANTNTFVLVTTPLALGGDVYNSLANIGNVTQIGIEVHSSGHYLNINNGGTAQPSIDSITFGTQLVAIAIGKTAGDEILAINANDARVAAAGVNASGPGVVVGGNAGAVIPAMQYFSECFIFNNEIDTNTWTNLRDNVISYYSISDTTSYIAKTAVFDGSNDYMTRATTMTGLADGNKVTFSGWVRFDGGNGTYQKLLEFATAARNVRFGVQRTDANLIHIYGYNTTPTVVLSVFSTTTVTTSDGWTHIYICIDLSDTAKRKIYINGISDTLTVSTYDTSGTIDLEGASYYHRVGASTSNDGGAAPYKLNGALADYWFDDSYLDDPTLFYNSGSPVPLGGDGSIPTGASPVIFFQLGGNSFGVNYGTAGTFTVTGSLTETTPP